MRFVLAFGPAVYLSKLFIWDKMLGLGRTDDLSNNLWYVAMTVVGFYFLQWTVSRTARVVSRWFPPTSSRALIAAGGSVTSVIVLWMNQARVQVDALN
jgi:hypothetical protein